MTTAEAIQALLDAATTEGKSPAEVIELYRVVVKVGLYSFFFFSFFHPHLVHMTQ